MDSAINERVKRIVASKTTEYVVEKLVGDDRDRIEQARVEEQQAKARAMARAAAANNSSGAPSSGSEPRVIEDMMADEDCPICRSILAAVSEMDEPRRTRGIAEYGRFREATDRSEEAAIEVLESSDILSDALEDIRQMGEI